MIEMQRRELYLPVFHIDTNLINARGKLDTMNLLEKWASEYLISIVMSDTGMSEALAGEDGRRHRKAMEQIYTINEAPPDKSDWRYELVAKALWPDGPKNQNQENDVAIVMEAIKYNAYLVSNDGGSKSQAGGIVGNRDKFQDHVKVLRPQEAVDLVRQAIQKRDDFNRKVAAQTGQALPEWTGKDG